MSFHRLTVPGYFGGLPGGYDYINNAISGTPAPANPVLASGPNTGSYFIGFGDDATSANGNRANLALATNTDYLDDLLHSDLAVPTSSVLTTSAGDTTYVAVGIIYVGKPGTPNTAAGILSFAKVLDLNGNEIEVAGVAVQVASISGATVGTTWSSGNVTFTFNIPIPAAVQYRVWYATRGNLATLPVDVFTNITIRSTQELPAAFEDFQEQIAQFSGLNVVSLVGTRFETPDGTRLAKSSVMNFWVDPDGTNGGTHTWNWTIGGTTLGTTTPFYITDNPAGLTGPTGLIARSSGTIDYFVGAWTTSDLNSRNNSAAAPYHGQLLVTDSSVRGSNVQTWDQNVTATDVSTSGVNPSLVSSVNARWTVTCGDGSNSFGDFTGPFAIAQALTYASAHFITSGRIQVKSGSYSVDGSNQIATPANGYFIIEGVDPVNTHIQGVAGAPSALIRVGGGIGAGAVLELRNLTVTRASGTATRAVDFSGSTLYLENVDITSLCLFAEKPTRASSARNCFHAKRCSVDPTGLSSVATLTIKTDTPTGTGDEVIGVVFEDCALTSVTDYPIFLAQASATLTGVGAISGVKFSRCEINLGAATGVSQHIGGLGAGVFSVDANGMSNGSPVNGIYPNLMYVRDIEWRDCYVRAVENSGSGSNILMHLVPFTNGQTAPTSVVAVGTVSIRGGRWEIGDASFENFSPFFCAARNVVIEDVAFRGNTVGGNGSPTKDMQNALLGNGLNTAWTDSGATTTPYAQNWGAFTIAPGANQIYDVAVIGGGSDSPVSSGQIPTAPGCTIKNMSICNLPRDGGCGDLLLNVARYNNNVQGIRLHGYVDTTLGFSLPTFRAWIFASGPSYGTISGISLTGANSIAGHQWLDNTGQAGEHVGLFRITAGGRLHVKDCSANLFLVNSVAGTSSYGFNMAIPAAGGTPYNPAGLLMEYCYADSCLFGFICTSASATHPQTTFRLNHCTFTANTDDGALVNFTNVGAGNEAVLEQCQINNNTRYGLNIIGAFHTADLLSVTGNSIKGNSGAYQVQYIPTTEPGGVFMNNDLGVSGLARAKPGGVAITSSTPMLGFESGTGANLAARAYSNGVGMLFNSGGIATV